MEKLDVHYDFENKNDASASAFGWYFQRKAALYVFFDEIKDIKQIAVETLEQDIEITYSDKIKYIQAKSLQDENVKNTENKKLRDAIVSLVKVNLNNNDELEYISNLKDPIKDSADKFRLNTAKCSNEEEKYIKNQINIIINKIKIQKDFKEDCNKQELVRRLNNFNFNNFYITTLYPFGCGKYKDKVIRDKIMDVLSDMQLNEEIIRDCSKKIMNYCDGLFEDNLITKDNQNHRKSLSKSNLVWAMIVFASDKDYFDEIKNYVDVPIDENDLDVCRDYLSNVEVVYHERFFIMNKVIMAYENFKKTYKGTDEPEISFIKNNWVDYVSEFEDIDLIITNNTMKELIVKYFMLKFIKKRRNCMLIKKGANL